jgi:Fe-S-cluster containining protein
MIRTAEEPSTDSATLDAPFEKTKCGGCTALCCSYFALEIDAPDEPDDFENLRWYIIHEDVQIFVDDDSWYLQLNRKCTWLDGNRCGNYENRPQICRDYTDELCDFDGPQSDLTFKNIKELEAYRDEWVARYEAKEKKAANKKAKRKKNKKKAKGRKGAKA